MELVIRLDKERMEMETVANQVGEESGRRYDIRVFMYNVIPDRKGNSAKVEINEYREIFDEDGIHDEYSKELKKKNIWIEDKE